MKNLLAIILVFYAEIFIVKVSASYIYSVVKNVSREMLKEESMETAGGY